MKRACVRILVVITLGGVAFSTSLAVRNAEAQDNRSVTVEVASNAIYGDAGEGDACLLPGQVIITDAAGVIVGTVDLVDITTVSSGSPVYQGTVTDGLCVASESLELPDSTFYTFTIRDLYEWTASADDLEANDSTMIIDLSP